MRRPPRDSEPRRAIGPLLKLERGRLAAGAHSSYSSALLARARGNSEPDPANAAGPRPQMALAARARNRTGPAAGGRLEANLKKKQGLSRQLIKTAAEWY